MALLIVNQSFLHSSLRIEMGLCGLSGGEEVTNYSADWHFNSLLYSDVLLQLLLSLFCIWRMWGGFIVTPIPSAFKYCEVSWPHCLIWFYYYNLISMFHKNELSFLFFALLLNVSGIFFRRPLLHERCL